MRRPYNVTGSFLDLLFNILISFFMLLLIAIVLIRPEAKKHDIELKAEYIITMEWPNGSKDDVDLMVRTPLKEIVYYGKKDIKASSLDRDDRGSINDYIILEDGTKVIIEENWEHVSLRKTFKGEYVVNAYMFRKTDKKPTLVKVKIEKLNPYKLIYSKTVKMTRARQESTILRFRIDKNGKVIHRSTEPFSIRNTIERRDR